jgi:membrane protein CcdC involved in cytochrome C biogenesis
MFICMDASLVIFYLATQNWKATLGMGVFFALVLIWASRYPGSKEESDRRKAAGEKVGWLK